MPMNAGKRMMGNGAGMLNEALPPMSTAAISPVSETGGRRGGGQGTPEEGGFGEGVVDREDVLARYRRLREISRDHGIEVLKRVPKKTLLDWGKRLGLVRKKAFVAASFEEMTLAIDLAVYSARPGKTPPVERYRRTAGFPAGSDEAIMLDAMCRSRFSLFIVKRRHAAAGLVLEDLFRRQEIWLMDEGFEASAPKGMVIASRVVKPDVYHMTTGAAVPVVQGVPEEMAARFSFGGGDTSLEDGRNVKFVEAVYATAVAWGLMETMRFE